jgi:hypothetical protein
VWRHQLTDGVAIVIGSMTLFLLVVTRMAQLLRQIERQSKQLSQLTRVDELTGLPNRRAWSAKLRAVDQLARYGGEEFIVLLPGATAELATSVLERLRGSPPPGRRSRPVWPPGTATRPPRSSSPAPTRRSTRPRTPAATASWRRRRRPRRQDAEAVWRSG